MISKSLSIFYRSVHKRKTTLIVDKLLLHEFEKNVQNAAYFMNSAAKTAISPRTDLPHLKEKEFGQLRAKHVNLKSKPNEFKRFERTVRRL